MFDDDARVAKELWTSTSPDGRWTFLAPRPRPGLTPGAGPPSFSVVIAAWAASSVVAGALESALAQTVPALEIIVADDGSTDDLGAALEPYQAHIQVLDLEHRGEAATKNAGARAASGDFVVFLDADDVFDSHRLEALGALAVARPDLDILTTDAHLEVAGAVVRRCYTDAHPFEVADQRGRILRRNFVFGLAAARRARLLEVGGFDEMVERTSDWACWIRMILTGSSVGLVDAPLARYRVRRESLSSDRLGMAQGGLTTLERSLHLPAATGEDLDHLAEGIADHRRRVVLLAARTALREGWPDVRTQCRAAARRSDVATRTRVKLLVVSWLPASVLRRLAAREAGRWTGAGGTVVDIDED